MSILSCIEKLGGVSISDQMKHMFSEQWITERCHITVLSTGNLPHVDPYTHL